MGRAGRLRVALISFNFGEYCVRLAGGLASEADVLLIVPRQILGSYASELPGSVRVLSFESPRLRQPTRQIRMLRNLLREIREFAPHVIHYQGGHLWFGLAFSLLRRYPRVLTIHDFLTHPGDLLSKKSPFWIESLARHCADELIVHTRHVQGLVSRHRPGWTGRITVIPHVQIGQVSVGSNGQRKEPVVLFFGRIWEYKGLEYLIRAEPWITARVPAARILIAGQGEDFSRYARIMSHPGHFIVDNSFITDELAAEYFRRASVVVLPYIEASQSGVIPMAYSAGKPVVATRVGGLPEMVEHGVTGYLVPPRSSVQLAEAITRLLIDERLRLQMGANGKRKIETEWSPRAIALKTLEVYYRAIERYSAATETTVPASLPLA
jgi:glycosyltransferase involved in cell wall biosynthesis